MANGQTITRSVGFAVLRVDKHFTIDEGVFGDPGDMTLLGARTLEGLSLVVDPRKKKLVAAGPLQAAGNQAQASALTVLACGHGRPMPLGFDTPHPGGVVENSPRFDAGYGLNAPG